MGQILENSYPMESSNKKLPLKPNKKTTLPLHFFAAENCQTILYQWLATSVFLFLYPKDHWTLQWKGLNLYSRRRGLKIASFEDSMILRVSKIQLTSDFFFPIPEKGKTQKKSPPGVVENLAAGVQRSWTWSFSSKKSCSLPRRSVKFFIFCCYKY